MRESTPDSALERSLKPTGSGKVRKSQRINLSDFATPRTKKIAKSGHQALRTYIVIKEAFPLPIQKDTLSWDCVVAGVKGDTLLKTKLDSLRRKEEDKSRLLDYVSVKSYLLIFCNLLICAAGVGGGHSSKG